MKKLFLVVVLVLSIYVSKAQTTFTDNTGQGFRWTLSGQSPMASLTNLGRLGIGTLSPASNAHFVYNQSSTTFGTTSSYLVLSNANTTAQNKSGIAFSSNAAGLGTSLITAQHNRDAANSGRLTFYTRNLSGNLAEALTIDENSNVGLGTAFPQSRLDIVSNISWQLKLENTNAGGGKWYFGASSNGWQVGGGKFLIGTTDVSTSAKFALDTQGNLGLGTPSPLDRLHLYKATGVVRQLLETGDNSTIGIHIKHNNHTSSIGLAQNSNVLKINNTGSFGDNHLVITETGKVGIGTSVPGADALAVNGTIKAKEVKVSIYGWSDFVFEEDYNLMPLEEVETYIKQNKHLPEIPSAKEVEENGVNLGTMDAILLQKIEELTLYMIEQNKKIESLEKKVEELQK